MESRAIVLGVPGSAVPGGLLRLDGLVFIALIEGILRDCGPEAEEAVNSLYEVAPAAAPSSQESREAAIQRMMRFGG